MCENWSLPCETSLAEDIILAQRWVVAFKIPATQKSFLQFPLRQCKKTFSCNKKRDHY